MASLAETKVHLQDLQDQRPKIEKQLEDANRQYKIGLWGVLIGIFLIPLFGIGILLILAGGLAALTNRIKRSTSQSKLSEMEDQIRQLRLEIAQAESSE
jgi:hypothetical protein